MTKPARGGRGGAGGSGAGPARREKVARLKSSVRSGRYRVAPDKVAEKMVEDAVRALRGRCRGH